ncbi:MAG: hypothetical protein EOM12_15180 [Verrucomicrobiae bacterium]|nr:hypothetical protein [Verrucomicrobiae bacterium]
MAEISDLISHIRNSGLSKGKQDELMKRLLREGPSDAFDREISNAVIEHLAAPKGIYAWIEKINNVPKQFQGILVLAVFALIFLPMLYFMSPDREKTKPTPPAFTESVIRKTPAEMLKQEATRGSAFTWVKAFVKNNLKSPGTATFASLWDTQFTDRGNYTWEIDSYVDAQNSLGAQVRTYFTAVVRYENNNRWEVLSMKMN